MGVFPADHVIAREGRYRQLVRGAFRAAERGKMVVLGILPRWAETGYGYIEFPRGTEPGPKPVAIRGFHEKPDARTARRYVAAGRFFWNAGMFFWRARVLLDELRRNLPRTASILAALPAFHDAGFVAKLREAFPLCENISDRFRRDGESARCHRHRVSRDRLERRGKLERRLRAAAARHQRKRAFAGCHFPGSRRATTWMRPESWWHWWVFRI